MNWQWTSRRGNNRQSNNDAVAIVSEKSFFFALLVDAAEKGNKGAELARYWTQTIADLVRSASGCPSMDQLVDYMQNTHKQLRVQYLHETASYIMLIYDKTTGNGWVLHCGDCRLGIMQPDGINWLTNVHTLANADGNFFNPSHYGDPKRHTVTRCLNAKRFAHPEKRQIALPENTSWLLCTDGYWAEYKGEGKEWNQLSDDASCLEISNQLSQQFLLSSDCKNCFNYSLDQINEIQQDQKTCSTFGPVAGQQQITKLNSPICYCYLSFNILTGNYSKLSHKLGGIKSFSMLFSPES